MRSTITLAALLSMQTSWFCQEFGINLISIMAQISFVRPIEITAELIHATLSVLAVAIVLYLRLSVEIRIVISPVIFVP
jgi:hypothetical protein